MNCDRVREYFVNRLDRELLPYQEKAFLEHLDKCPGCRLEVNNLSGIWTKLDEFSETIPSEELSSRFYTMLENVELSHKTERKVLRLSTLEFRQYFYACWPSKPVWAAFYTVFLIFFSIFFTTMLDIPSNIATDKQKTRNEMTDLYALLAITLINQDTAQERLQGIKYSKLNDLTDPKILNLLLHTIDNDESSNVRLSALDALLFNGVDSQIRQHITRSLATETSPLVQLKMIDLLMKYTQSSEGSDLSELIQSAGLDENIAEYLQSRELIINFL